MLTSSKIYVAGHRGLVGSALLRRLQHGGFGNIVSRTHAELDLTDQRAVETFFQTEQPEYVFLAAAKVGGIHANNTYRADFIYQNLAMQCNIIHAAYRHGVKKLLFLGSSCIYPKHAPQPMKEDYLLSGKLEPTNEPYAIAKIAGIKMCGAYNTQYGCNFMSVMPTNLYGPNDNYDLQTSHVIPALIRKIHQAKQTSNDTVTIWGSGKPRREFLYSDDLADACLFLMTRYTAADVGEFINIGIGQDNSIREIATLIAEVVGYPGRFVYDSSKPDGTPQKLLDISQLDRLGWKATTGFKDGLAKAYKDFQTKL
ncbi:MAG: GDP-L-fucose synthase [Gammaproteobacteria bacterium]|nr:GDP-L-fucose synthase [Gammaproteobacteria bacterium]